MNKIRSLCNGNQLVDFNKWMEELKNGKSHRPVSIEDHPKGPPRENKKLICSLYLQLHISGTHYGTNTLETKRLIYDIDFLLKN